MRTIACLTLALAALFTASCTPFMFAAHVFDSGTEPGAFALPPRPTVVVVEDAGDALGNSGLKSLLAQTIETNISDQIKKITFIPQQKLLDLQNKKGDQYNTMAINRIGLELGAEQVIYVNVESVHLNAQPGLVVPDAAVRLKVVDARTGKRLYPVRSTTEADTSDRGALGAETSVAMGYVPVESDSQAALGKVFQQLVDKLGAKVAENFYEHKREREKSPSEL